MTLKKRFHGKSSGPKPTQLQIDNFVTDAAEGVKEAVRHFCKTFPGYIDALDSNGDTALAVAAERNCVETGTLLLYAGANPNLPAKDGASPLLRWIMTIRPKKEQKDMRLLEAMLAHDANINARQRGTDKSGLMFYAAFSNEKLCDYLLSHGLDPTLKDSDGKTARRHALDMSDQLDGDSAYYELKELIDHNILTLETAEKDRRRNPTRALAKMAAKRLKTLS